MRAYVVVATRGRAQDVQRLVGRLGRQTRPPAKVIVVGVSEADTEPLETTNDGYPFPLLVAHSGAPGLTIQRNIGIDLIRRERPGGSWFVAFYDDDFRPADDWLEAAAAVFEAKPMAAGVTGQLLADGIKGRGLSEEEADAFLSGRTAPQGTWTSGPERAVSSAYGCNMAFAGCVFETCRFDERLPLYGWQEDRDFTGQVMRLGEVVLIPSMKGVHLGAKSGRTSGVKMGYSQIANPLYLRTKGTMCLHYTRRFLTSALLANMAKSLRKDPAVDYRGRLRGNALALRDLILGKLSPERILELE